MPVSASAARRRPRAMEGRWTSANGMETSTTSMANHATTSGGADSRRLTIPFIESPGFFEAAHRAGYRRVVLMDPLVVLHHFVHQACFLAFFVRCQAIKIIGLPLQR